MKLPPEYNQMDELLREMHHCVRNNFQIIASLINLQKRMLPSGRRGEMRFIEEHVQSMAVVYRVSDPRGLRVPVNRLIVEVSDNLRQIAGVPPEVVTVSTPENDETIEQQHAVALALFLAVVLPPYLDRKITQEIGLSVVLTTEADRHFIMRIADRHETIELEPLRQRLATAYLRQLQATTEPRKRGIRLHFRLGH